MVKIYVDTEEQKERLIKSLEDSSTCPFLGGISGCLRKGCRDCIKENIEFHVIEENKHREE